MPAVRTPQIVIDTNVVVSALRSQRGASYRLLMLVDGGRFETNLSVALFLECQQACRELVGREPLTQRDVTDILDYICQAANQRRVYYLWRPLLTDPKDDMVLEVAVAANCDCIVTYNKKDFRGAERFAIRVLTPREFLKEIGERA